MIVNHPAALRNTDPIFSVLEPELIALGERSARTKAQGLTVLEVASGPGQHIEAFAQRCPGILWQPSEPQDSLRASIDERVRSAGLDNVVQALELDVCADWPNQTYDLVMAVNLVHISPWTTTEALLTGASSVLGAGGTLMLYGPYRLNGEHNSQGNVDFDADLKRRNPEWGIRDLEAVAEQAASVGLPRLRVIDMPANNRVLFFNRSENRLKA